MIKILIFIAVAFLVPFAISGLAIMWRNAIRRWRLEDEKWKRERLAEARRELEETYELLEK